MEIITWQSAP